MLFFPHYAFYLIFQWEFMECGYRMGAGEGIMRSDDGWKEVADEFCLRLSRFYVVRPWEDNGHLFSMSTEEWARGRWLIRWQRRSGHTMNFTADKLRGHWNHWPSALWVGWHALLWRPPDTSVWPRINVVWPRRRRMDKFMLGPRILAWQYLV